MRKAIRGILQSDSGQSLVELCLTVPLLLLILVGASEVARFAYYSIAVENAAHAGALYAGQNTTSANDTAGITSIANQEAASIGGGSTVTVTSVNRNCTCFSPLTSTNAAMASCFASCPSPSTLLQYVQVNTKGVAPTLFNYPGLAGATFTVYGSATAAVRQ